MSSNSFYYQWPFTSNLHYPYGRDPIANTSTIADDDLAAVSQVLGYDNWARWSTLKQSHHTQIDHRNPYTSYQEPPIMDHLPFPDQSTSPSASAQSPTTTPLAPHDTRSSSSTSASTSPPAPAYPLLKIEVDHPMLMTWPLSDPDSPDPDTHPTHHSRKHHPARPRESRALRSPSPHVSPRQSPPPPTKRAGKKPSLACLFCRTRKIACGPPPPGSDEKTCNQCFRRHLDCEYPLESRRGLRNKRLAGSGSSSSSRANGTKVTIRVPRRRYL